MTCDLGRANHISSFWGVGLMEFIPFILVVSSAVSHACWNVFAKRGSDKEAFMWWMSFTSFFTMLPVFYVLLPDWGLPMVAVPYLVVSGIAETAYFLSLGRAYELGDLSVVYPLARSSPLFLFVLAVVFFGEEVSPWGVLGILLVVLGVYMIHLKEFSMADFLKPVTSLRARASQFALLTALCTSIYSLTDKLGVTAVTPLVYAFWLDVFVIVFLTPVVLWRRGWTAIMTEWRGSSLRVLVSGFLMRFGYVLVLVAMSLTQVSYILALRQLSVVLGVVFGVGLLGERYGRVRLLSSIIIFAGVLILGVMT